jgi:hypothetical protein
LGAQQPQAGLLIAEKQKNKNKKTKENMQALLLALIAVRDAYRRQEPIVPEPYKFQPFDLQALRQVYRAKDTSPSRPSDRQESYVAHSVS